MIPTVVVRRGVSVVHDVSRVPIKHGPLDRDTRPSPPGFTPRLEALQNIDVNLQRQRARLTFSGVSYLCLVPIAHLEVFRRARPNPFYSYSSGADVGRIVIALFMVSNCKSRLQTISINGSGVLEHLEGKGGEVSSPLPPSTLGALSGTRQKSTRLSQTVSASTRLA